MFIARPTEQRAAYAKAIESQMLQHGMSEFASSGKKNKKVGITWPYLYI
jgi:hypothetical protein